jgi:hypothetical protein
VLQAAMSGLVVLAGLFVVATGSGGLRWFGWLLVVVGLLGVGSAFVRPRRRR